MPISKTDFIRGLQCEKMLWLDAHAPEHKVIPPEVQAKLDAGNEFGDNAMGSVIDGAHIFYYAVTTLFAFCKPSFSTASSRILYLRILPAAFIGKPFTKSI